MKQHGDLNEIDQHIIRGTMTSHKIRIPQFVKLMVRKCYEKDLTPEEISKKLGITLSKVNFILDK